MKARAEVSIRDRIEDSVRSRPLTQTVLRADDVIMVWKTNPPSKQGRWVGPGVCVGTHRGSVWVTEESRGLEIQNQLLDSRKLSFNSSRGVECTQMWSAKESRHRMLAVHQRRFE